MNSRDFDPPSPRYQSPYAIDSWRNSIRRGQDVQNLRNHVQSDTFVFPQCAPTFSKALCDGDVCVQSQTAEHTSVPPESPEVPIIGACGGHCPGFEYVCYYILQVIIIFIIYNYSLVYSEI